MLFGVCRPGLVLIKVEEEEGTADWALYDHQGGRRVRGP